MCKLSRHIVSLLPADEGPTKSIAGPGLGYVRRLYNLCQLVQRLDRVTNSSSMGMALAPLDFVASSLISLSPVAAGGTKESSGFIAAYNLTTGHSTVYRRC